jgi:hypothetical protein
VSQFAAPTTCRINGLPDPSDLDGPIVAVDEYRYQMRSSGAWVNLDSPVNQIANPRAIALLERVVGLETELEDALYDLAFDSSAQRHEAVVSELHAQMRRQANHINLLEGRLDELRTRTRTSVDAYQTPSGVWQWMATDASPYRLAPTAAEVALLVELRQEREASMRLANEISASCDRYLAS